MAQDRVSVELDFDIDTALTKLNKLDGEFQKLLKEDKRINFSFDVNVKGAKKLDTDVARDIAKAFNSAEKSSESLTRKQYEFNRALQASKRDLEQFAKNIENAINKNASTGSVTLINRLNSLWENVQLQIEKVNGAIDLGNAKLSRSVQESSSLYRALKEVGDAADGIGKTGGINSLIAKLTIGGILVEGFKQSVQALGQLVSSGIAFEQLVIGLEAFTSGTEEAERLYKSFKSTALKTPFGLEQVAQAGKTLLAFGVSSQEATSSVKLLAVAAGATGSDLNNLARNLGQISAQNRAFKRDLDQFALAGIGIYNALAEVTGKTVTQVQELASEGKIGFDEVKNALVSVAGAGSAFAQIADKQLETVAGQIGNLQTVVFEFSGALVKEFGPITGTVLKGLTSAVEVATANVGLLKNAFVALIALSAAKFFVGLTTSITGVGVAAKGLKVLVGLFGFLPEVTALAKGASALKDTLVLTGNGAVDLRNAFVALAPAIQTAAAAIAVFLLKVGLFIALAYGVYKAWQLFQPDDDVKEGKQVLSDLADAAKEAKDKLDQLNATATTNPAFIQRYRDASASISDFRKNLTLTNSTGLDGQAVFNALVNSVTGFIAGVRDAAALVKFNANLKELIANANKTTAEIGNNVNSIVTLNNALAASGQSTAQYADSWKGATDQVKAYLIQVYTGIKAQQQAIQAIQAKNAAEGGATEASQNELSARASILRALVEQRGALEGYLAVMQQVTAEAQRQAAAQKAADPVEQAKANTAVRKDALDLAEQYWNLEKTSIEATADKRKEALEAEISGIKTAQEAAQRKADQADKSAQKATQDAQRAAQEQARTDQKEIQALQTKGYWESILAQKDKDRLERKVRMTSADTKRGLQYRVELERITRAEEAEKKRAEAAQRAAAAQESIQKAQDAAKETKDTSAGDKQASEERIKGLQKQIDKIDELNKKYTSTNETILNQAKSILDIDNQIIEAKQAGNAALVSQLAYLRQITQAQAPDGTLNEEALNKSRIQYLGLLQNTQINEQQFAGIKVLKEVNPKPVQDTLDALRSATEPVTTIATQTQTASAAAKEQAGWWQKTGEYIDGVVQKLANLNSNAIANKLKNLLGLATGGPALGGRAYNVNELGQEAFLGISGALSMIKPDRNGKWIAPESGTVIPAHLTRMLDIPSEGMYIDPQQAGITSKVASSQSSAVADAMDSILNTQGAHAVELGRLTQSIRRMTDKEWAVNVHIDNNKGYQLIDKVRNAR